MIKTASEVRPVTEREYKEMGYLDCRHEWRIIESYHAEFPRESKDPRRYAAYCVYCLKSSGINVQLTNNKEE